MNDEAVLSDELFGRLSFLLHRKTGIALKDYKKYLVVSRLASLVGPAKRFTTFEDFYQALVQETDNILTQSFINALTTNYSYFFRDAVHFGAMGQYLRESAPGQTYLRFWSAASSTGEEAFTMAITLANHQGFLPPDRRILATDISTKVLAQAEAAVYSAEAVDRYVPASDQKRYFEPTSDQKRVRVRENLRSLVDFRQLNLQGPFPFRKAMDIIFLRNVMIYFGPQEKEVLVEKMYQHLKPGGLLFIGLSESLAGIGHSFVGYRNSIFLKPKA